MNLCDRSFVVICVYMPTDDDRGLNMPIFADCMSAISAIIESAGVECVYVLGDFNAHPGRPFGMELLSFCTEQNWLCADFEKLGYNADCFTFVSGAHGCHRWLDQSVFLAHGHVDRFADLLLLPTGSVGQPTNS